MQAASNEIAILVEQARLGDQRAWYELHRRCHRLIWDKILSKVRRCDLAADLVQETFLLAFRKLAQLREPIRFVGWLLIIARNRTADWLSSRQNGPVVTDLQPSVKLHELIDPRPGPAEEVQRMEESARMYASLEEMSTVHRHALEAFYLERRSLAQISQDTGKPVGTIKRRLCDARRRLAVLISRGRR